MTYFNRVGGLWGIGVSTNNKWQSNGISTKESFGGRRVTSVLDVIDGGVGIWPACVPEMDTI